MSRKQSCLEVGDRLVENSLLGKDRPGTFLDHRHYRHYRHHRHYRHLVEGVNDARNRDEVFFQFFQVLHSSHRQGIQALETTFNGLFGKYNFVVFTHMKKVIGEDIVRSPSSQVGLFYRGPKTEPFRPDDNDCDDYYDDDCDDYYDDDCDDCYDDDCDDYDDNDCDDYYDDCDVAEVFHDNEYR